MWFDRAKPHFRLSRDKWREHTVESHERRSDRVTRFLWGLRPREFERRRYETQQYDRHMRDIARRRARNILTSSLSDPLNRFITSVYFDSIWNIFQPTERENNQLTINEVRTTQVLMEKCIQYYMNQTEMEVALQAQAGVDPALTGLSKFVWKQYFRSLFLSSGDLIETNDMSVQNWFFQSGDVLKSLTQNFSNCTLSGCAWRTRSPLSTTSSLTKLNSCRKPVSSARWTPPSTPSPPLNYLNLVKSIWIELFILTIFEDCFRAGEWTDRHKNSRSNR